MAGKRTRKRQREVHGHGNEGGSTGPSMVTIKKPPSNLLKASEGRSKAIGISQAASPWKKNPVPLLKTARGGKKARRGKKNGEGGRERGEVRSFISLRDNLVHHRADFPNLTFPNRIFVWGKKIPKRRREKEGGAMHTK